MLQHRVVGSSAFFERRLGLWHVQRLHCGHAANLSAQLPDLVSALLMIVARRKLNLEADAVVADGDDLAASLSCAILGGCGAFVLRRRLAMSQLAELTERLLQGLQLLQAHLLLDVHVFFVDSVEKVESVVEEFLVARVHLFVFSLPVVVVRATTALAAFTAVAAMRAALVDLRVARGTLGGRLTTRLRE